MAMHRQACQSRVPDVSISVLPGHVLGDYVSNYNMHEWHVRQEIMMSF